MPIKEVSTSCEAVWDKIREVQKYDDQLFRELSDVFTDFECSWLSHADEFHTD